MQLIRMFMNDNLDMQIHAYDNIYEYHDKMLFMEQLLHYYKHTSVLYIQ